VIIFVYSGTNAFTATQINKGSKMERKAKEYTNGEVTIVWKSEKCMHSGNCFTNNPGVFKPLERPWVTPENSTTSKIIETVKKCPSGALTFYLNDKK
jgi:uncharacterized Fe-S cluster protein YjdI